MSAERRFLDSHPYEIQNLWKIAEKKITIMVPVHMLETSHKKKYWINKHGQPISAFEVLKYPTLAPFHNNQSEKANLDFPIILAASNLDVLDGLHRINKSIQLGQTDIKAQFVSVSDLKRDLPV